MPGKLPNDGPMTSAEKEASKRALTEGKVVEAIPVVFFARLISPVWSIISDLLKKGDAVGNAKLIESRIASQNKSGPRQTVLPPSKAKPENTALHQVTVTPGKAGKPPTITTQPSTPASSRALHVRPTRIMNSPIKQLPAVVKTMTAGRSIAPSSVAEVRSAQKAIVASLKPTSTILKTSTAAASSGEEGEAANKTKSKPVLVDREGTAPYGDDSTPTRSVKPSTKGRSTGTEYGDVTAPRRYSEQTGRKVIRDWLGDDTQVEYGTRNEAMEEQNLRRGGSVKKKASSSVKKKVSSPAKKKTSTAKSKYGMNKGGFTKGGGNYY